MKENIDKNTIYSGVDMCGTFCRKSNMAGANDSVVLFVGRQHDGPNDSYSQFLWSKLTQILGESRDVVSQKYHITRNSPWAFLPQNCYSLLLKKRIIYFSF